MARGLFVFARASGEVTLGPDRVARSGARVKLPVILSTCLVSEKCTSTMPTQNDRGYCTPNHCVQRGKTEKRQKQSKREKERKREIEKRLQETLGDRNRKARACKYKPGHSCLANWGQFAAGEKCRTPQVVYNTDNFGNHSPTQHMRPHTLVRK